LTLYVQRRAGSRKAWKLAHHKGRAHLRHLSRRRDVLRRRGWDDARIYDTEPTLPGGCMFLLPPLDRYAPGAAMNRCRWAINFRRQYGFYPRGRA
jgi:hypothetical protein